MKNGTLTIRQALQREERISHARPWANLEVRRTCWHPGAHLGVGTEAIGFYSGPGAERQDWAPCPADLVERDWEVVEVPRPAEDAR